MRRWMIWIVLAVTVLAMVTCAALSAGTYLILGQFLSGPDVPTAVHNMALDANPTPEPFSSSGPPAPSGRGRLLILDDDDNVITVQPDGSDPISLVDDASATRTYRQPTWSPDGSQIAVAQIDEAGGEVATALVTVGADGTDDNRIMTESAPFYIYWSPEGKHLAYLSSGSEGIDLGVVDTTVDQGQVSTLDRGQSLYFSWAPDGQRLLTHVGSDRLGLVALDGGQTTLQVQPAAFAAPQWTRDGGGLIYAIEENSASQLVVSGTDGILRHRVAEYDGVISFGASPDGKSVAFIDTTIPVGLAFGPLIVSQPEGGKTETVSDDTVAFFWSPQGTHLLYLHVEVEPNIESATEVSFPAQEEGQVWFRWYVWDGSRTIPLGRFEPSPIFFVDYLPYFDQYAQSMTLWSPDESAFVYAGTGENGTSGIWVQRIADEQSPVLVASGVMATWSPR